METRLHSPKKGRSPLPNFPPISVVAERLDASTYATWSGGKRLCFRWDPAPLPKKGAEPPPQFLAHVYCGRMAGCIKMPLGMEVGLSPGDFVLNGDPSPPQEGAGPPVFGACLLWPNGCMVQDATWYGGMPRPRRHYVRWGPNSPSPKRGRAPSSIFGPCQLWPNCWMDQYGTWRGGEPWSKPHCARWGPSSFPQKRSEPPIFVPCLLCQTAVWIKMPLGTEVNLDPGDVVLDGVAAPPPPKKGHSPQILVHVSCGQTAGWMKTPLGTK